jgi:hypothetical protein
VSRGATDAFKTRRSKERKMPTWRRLCTACSVGIALLAAGASAEAAGERAVSIRITRFEVDQPDRVREIHDASTREDTADGIEARSRAVQALWEADPDPTDPLTPEEAAALHDAMGLESDGGKLVSKSDREYRQRIWNATRGLSPAVEVECVLRAGQEAPIRVWDARLDREFLYSYRLAKLSSDEAVYEKRSDAGVGAPLMVERVGTLRFDDPQVGALGLGGESCDVSFLELRAASAGRDTGTCSVHYAPGAAPPTDVARRGTAGPSPKTHPAAAAEGSGPE